ncbi:MAG: HAD-IC family P-type ATPase, partial [Clostridia bacterium]|nr:HAD-IC family P-type ATPase [Clostridia bacterium]
MKNHHCCSSHEKEPDKAAHNGCSCSHAPKEDMCSCGHVHDKDDCHCSHSPSEHSCRCSHTHNEDSCGNHPEKHHAHSDCGCGCGHDHDEDEQKRLPLLIACVGVFGILLVLERLVPIHRALLLLLYLIPYLGAGWPILVRSAKNLLHGRIFDENLLMSVASIGAFSIGQYEEGTAVTLFFCIGEWLESVAVGRTRRSVQSLMEIRPDTARIVCDDLTTRQVDAALVCVGDIIEVRVGERIPLDGIVTNGSAGLNTSALTGESLPRTVGVGDPVFAGCVCTDSDLRIAVTRPAAESTVQRILDTAQHAAEKKTRTEAFITRFSRVYTPIVVIGALMLAVIPTLIVGSPLTWIHRALTFLVVSCPCALVISVPLSFFCGIGGASSKGILIKSSQAIEALAHTEIVASDKTGTLTHGKFRVTGIHPLNDMTEDALLALAAQAEAHSSHPAALGILAAYRESGAEQSYTEVTHTTVAGRGVKATIEGDTVLVGNTAMMQEFGIA